MPVPEQMPLVEMVRDPALLDILRRVHRHRRIGEAAHAAPRPTGAPSKCRPLRWRCGPARGAIAILHDITDLERLERIRKDFVANVSHELRTPLTAIRGYAETLLEGALEDQENNRRFLEIIRAHAIRLNNIASRSAGALGAGIGPGRRGPEPVPMRAALEAAMRTVESEARVRGVRCTGGELEDARGLGHRIRLEQAFVNLLDNAVKFNRPGGEVRVETAARRTARRASPSPTPASASRARTCRASSSASIAWTRPARARWAAPAWGFPSSSTSSSG